MKHKILNIMLAVFVFGFISVSVKGGKQKVDLRKVKLIYGSPYLLGEYFNPVSKTIFVFDANKTERTFTVEVNNKKFERDPKTGLYTMLGFVPKLSDYATLPEVDKTNGTYEIKGKDLIIKYSPEELQKKINLTNKALLVKKKVRKARIINDTIIKFYDNGEIYVKYNPTDFQPPIVEATTIESEKQIH